MTIESTPIQNGYHDWKSLSQIYGLSEKTLRRRLDPIMPKIKEKGTLVTIKKKVGTRIMKVKSRIRYFNSEQLKLIVLNLGDPMNYTFNGKKFIRDSE